jgi:type I restriction enzyme S subunit
MRVKLKDITKFSKGTQINGKNLIDDGAYSYLNGGINPSGKWNEFNVAENTVTISEGGNSSGYVNYMNEAFWCGAHCYYLYDGPKNSKYLYYALKSQQERLFRIRSGACMPNIKKSDLGNFIIEYEKDEVRQEEVVKVLEKCELLIEDYNKKLTLLDEAVRARFVEVFGDPNYNPKGYKKDIIKDHIDLLSGYPFKSENYVDSGINICGGLVIMPQKIKWEECVHWKSAIGYENYLLNNNDIVMALDRPWISEGFKIAKVDSKHLPALLIQRTVRIRAIDMNQDYLYYCFICGGFNKHCNVTGSLVPHISSKDIKSFEVMLPPLELQNQFASFVQEIDKSRLLSNHLLFLIKSISSNH